MIFSRNKIIIPVAPLAAVSDPVRPFYMTWERGLRGGYPKGSRAVTNERGKDHLRWPSDQDEGPGFLQKTIDDLYAWRTPFPKYVFLISLVIYRNICTQTNIGGGMSVWRGLSLMSSWGITVGIVMIGGCIRLMVAAVWTPCSVTIWHLVRRAGLRFRVWILIIREIGTTFRIWVLSGRHSPSWIITPKPVLMRHIQALRWWIRGMDVKTYVPSPLCLNALNHMCQLCHLRIFAPPLFSRAGALSPFGCPGLCSCHRCDFILFSFSAWWWCSGHFVFNHLGHPHILLWRWRWRCFGRIIHSHPVQVFEPSSDTGTHLRSFQCWWCWQYDMAAVVRLFRLGLFGLYLIPLFVCCFMSFEFFLFIFFVLFHFLPSWRVLSSSSLGYGHILLTGGVGDGNMVALFLLH